MAKVLITKLESHIQKCEVNWGLENIANKKIAKLDQISAELFKTMQARNHK